MPCSKGLVCIIKGNDNVNFIFNVSLLLLFSILIIVNQSRYLQWVVEIFKKVVSIWCQQRKKMYTVNHKQVIFFKKSKTCGPYVTYWMCNLANYLIFGKRLWRWQVPYVLILFEYYSFHKCNVFANEIPFLWSLGIISGFCPLLNL